MVLNEMIRGAAGIGVVTEGEGWTHRVTGDDLKEAVTSVMEEYTSLRNWHLMTVSEEVEGDQQDLQVSIGKTESNCGLMVGDDGTVGQWLATCSLLSRY